ncbi:hypothetical protein HU200_058595 [Digitaria exilis]|uniref:Uncharacterized protein n=1 Tax=Digitaria exilis TaxID=1010633 RepID=A0A835E0H2_9POAL|nr:hypothetical protein HU200_058595 [Digitaria exilis]
MATVVGRLRSAARSIMRLLGPSQHVPFVFVLKRFVDLESPPVDLHQQWATIACPIRKASGCGKHGQRVVEGLTLYARLITTLNLTSALYIELNDDALQRIKAEFGHGFDRPLIQIDKDHGGFHVVAFVESTDDDRFIFLTLLFSLR